MEYTSTTDYISAVKSSRELKLVSNEIAMTMFYNHVIRYINKLADLMLKYLRELQILEKNKR